MLFTIQHIDPKRGANPFLNEDDEGTWDIEIDTIVKILCAMRRPLFGCFQKDRWKECVSFYESSVMSMVTASVSEGLSMKGATAATTPSYWRQAIVWETPHLHRVCTT